MAVFSDVVNMSRGYLLVAAGVTDRLGPATTAFVNTMFGTIVFWVAFRPTWQTISLRWKPALLMGLNMALNNFAFQLCLRWVRANVLEPLLFLCTALFMVRDEVDKGDGKKDYFVFLWPLLGAVGIWALVADPAVAESGGSFTETVPDFRPLGWQVPEWVIVPTILLITGATYALHNRWLQEFRTEDKGKISTVAAIPALAAFAAVAMIFEGAHAGMVGAVWPDLLICAGLALVGAYLSGVVVVRAYERGLRRSSLAMLQPVRTLGGILLGMLIEMTLPGPAGVLGITVILLAAVGAADYQSRHDSGTE